MTSGASAADSVFLTDVDYREFQGGDNLLQSAYWGNFKAGAGWVPRGFSWTAGGEVRRFLLLERRFPGGLRMAYVPYGPELPAGLDGPAVSALLGTAGRELTSRLSKKCFMIRFDLAGEASGGTEPVSLEAPLKRAPYRVQPQDTVILDLRPDENTLLEGMHKKTRYNIRLAERKGVEVRLHQRADALGILPRWYRIYMETGERDGISLHPENYYRRLIEEAAAAGPDGPDMRLYTAHHGPDLLAGIIVACFGRRAVYMYGASSDRKRELMPNHLLQWRAIQDARAGGAEEYDLFGIPPADDPGHPMHGLWRFKTGFGGTIRHYPGAWDYPARPLIYRFYRGAEALRGKLASRRKKNRSH